MLKMCWQNALISALLICSTWILPSSADLNFHVANGGNENYFFRDNTTSGQLLLTSVNNTNAVTRLIAALPAGNNGAVVYFLPSAGSTTNVSITLVNGSLTSTTDEFDNAGIQADVSFNTNTTLGVTIIGAVRAMRDYVEGAGTMHEIFNYTLTSFNSTSVRLHRQYINTTDSDLSDPGSANGTFRGVDLYMSIPAGSAANISVTPSHNTTLPPQISIIVPDADTAQSIVRVRVLTNETSLTGLEPDKLFLPAANGTTPAIRQALQGLANGTNPAANQVSFLSFNEKSTAGGWRFLTHFGRDTMVALQLLMPIMTPDAIESVLGAVIERANSTGALCHEETIGDYASFININNNRSDLGNTPFFDYKMIDTDLYLLPALNHYLLDLPQGKGRATSFLARQATLQNGSYAEIVDRVANYNFGRALPFYKNQSHSNLLAFRPGQPVGNWRDSNQGTGYGTIPFDVNSALVPASLRATQSLIDAQILQPPTTDGTGVTVHGDVCPGDVAAVWEACAPGFFDVTVDGATAHGMLQDFANAAGVHELVQGDETSLIPDRLSFYALSLREDGSPVEVMNSDFAFNLVYGFDVSQDFLQHAINALVPFPRGLLTPVGMIVANPVYDTNTTNIQVFHRGAYHGLVAWSFQQGLMAAGLARQLSFCGIGDDTNVNFYTQPKCPPMWCNDSAFVEALRAAQSGLWTSIMGAADEIFSEVWTWNYDNSTGQFSVTDLASLSPDGTEADAIQLWSYGFLGLVNPAK